MDLSSAVRQRIFNLLTEKNMSLWGLFKASGVPMSTLSYFINGKRNLINLTTLLHICEGLNLTLKEFFDDPLFNDVEQE